MIESQARLDLEWVLTSPSLIRDPLAVDSAEFPADMVDTEHLDAFVADRVDHRVGRYFESLVLYWLEHVRRVDIIGAGIQIIDENRRTLGELDFVFDDLDGVRTHWEVAVKFFLHHPRPGESSYPGPNARDNFERKTGQLFDKQLPMSEIHAPDVRRRQACVRGRIFEHLGSLPTAGGPARLAPDCLGGRWLHACEVDQLAQFDDALLHVVPKPYWLAPLVDFEASGLEDFRLVLDAHFAADGAGHPIMVGLRDAGGREVERLCIVPDSWPQLGQ